MTPIEQSWWKYSSLQLNAATSNTYGAGIDPEAVPDMLKALIEFVECDKTSGTHAYSAYVNCKAAIEKAKLK